MGTVPIVAGSVAKALDAIVIAVSVRLTPGLPLVARRAPRVAELALRALRFAVEVVGPVATTM